MVYVILDKNIVDYEADIRDLVMAFYPYQDYKFVEVEDSDSFDMVYTRFGTAISDFYDGKIYKSRFETKNHIKRALYDYLHKKLK
ncbi:MAG: hypothetical protein MJ151_00425, partial [Lachnospiraceae bacterium]|nr:hypothetical protein [Lachnospiraceae bacterium]